MPNTLQVIDLNTFFGRLAREVTMRRQTPNGPTYPYLVLGMATRITMTGVPKLKLEVAIA